MLRLERFVEARVQAQGLVGLLRQLDPELALLQLAGSYGVSHERVQLAALESKGLHVVPMNWDPRPEDLIIRMC